MSSEPTTSGAKRNGKQTPKESRWDDPIDDRQSSDSNSPASSTFSCMLDPNSVDFNDYIHNLNGWIWQCQTWFQFYSNYQTVMYGGSNQPPLSSNVNQSTTQNNGGQNQNGTFT